ncbi:MAG: hypothetical protein H6808_03475 [Phycisphaera sp.]|nr:hypothetical protein [Phycisphaera sp.]
MFVIPSVVLMAAMTQQPTHVTIDQPFAASPSATQNITTLTATQDWHNTLRGVDTVIMHDFALDTETSVILDLRRRDIVDANATLRLNESGTFASPDVVMLGGHVAGDHDSLAYIAFSDSMTLGYIRTNGEQYIISSGPAGQGLETVIYNPSDLPEGAINFMDLACEAIDVPGRELNTNASRGVAFLGDPPCRVADVAIETDTEFRTDLFGGNATQASDYATMLVGAVSEVYERDLNVILNITFLRIWTTTDPWNQGGSTDQLFQFQDYWNANMTGEQRNGAHFLSGRGLGGGVAYVGALCYPDFDYALSGNLSGFFPYPLQNQNTQNWDFMVTAHEWGHNFGAPHTHQQSPLSNIDNCGNGNCSQLPGTIMSYCHLCGNGTGDVNLNFHPQNINSWMLAYLGSTGLYSGDGAPCDLTGNPLCNETGCIADTNGDGILSPADFSAWVAAFNAGAAACDQNGDGSCTPADFSAWVANYNAGC